MSLLYDEGQQAIAAESRRVLEARVQTEHLLPLLEQQGEYHAPFWETAKEQGWTALALPEAYGGLDLSLVELGLIAFQAGRTLSGAPFLTSTFGAARALLDHGSDELKNRMAAPVRQRRGDRRDRLCRSAGSGASQPGRHIQRRRAERHKAVGLGRIEGGRGHRAGAGCRHPGAGPGRPGRNGAPGPSTPSTTAAAPPIWCFAIRRQSCSPRASRRCDAALHILALQSVVTAHEQTGGAEALMERARDYAVTRKAFGQPIGAFQSVKHRIAELYGLVELARAGALHAATREGQSDFLKAAAAARIQATEAYDTAARDCVQVHGGIGVTWEAGYICTCAAPALSRSSRATCCSGKTCWSIS